MNKYLLVLLLFLYMGTTIFTLDTVIYPQFHSSNDVRYQDLLEIIKEALEKTKHEFGDYILKESKSVYNEYRIITETRSGQKLNIMWKPLDPNAEKQLIPIYIPTRKGILGYRVFIIQQSMQDEFLKINTLDQLKEYSAGQGLHWGDAEVFKHNNFKVVIGNRYEGLFTMLKHNRYDFFSRGINEAFKEIEERKTLFPNLCVEKSILLYYPWPYLLYVSPKNPKLAIRIEKGMRIMIEDGTLDKIFIKYHAESIKKANLTNRKLFKINNPFLNDKIPDTNNKIWYNPFDKLD